MNQKGEATLLGILSIVVLSGLVLLCALELQKAYQLLNRRTKLFLCAKETKGELNKYLKIMGRTNWAIKNLNRASMIAVFIPGLQGVAAEGQEAKKLIMQVQNFTLLSYLKTISSLKQKGCPLDPRMPITPFNLNGAGYTRDGDGAALLRKTKWTYFLFLKPYLLAMEINAAEYARLNPSIKFATTEKAAKLSSPSWPPF